MQTPKRRGTHENPRTNDLTAPVRPRGSPATRAKTRRKRTPHLTVILDEETLELFHYLDAELRRVTKQQMSKSDVMRWCIRRCADLDPLVDAEG